MRTGKILQVVGPVVDVVFPLEEGVPDIHNALQVVKTTSDGSEKTVTLETAVELGDGAVRTIAMESTDGLQRGMKVVDLGRTISVPVGPET
nr:F0F1 ATP synthase subunit beta [Escherichia coli]